MLIKIVYSIHEVEGGYILKRSKFDEFHSLIDSEEFETVHQTEHAALDEMEELGTIEYENLIEAGSGETDVEVVYERMTQ